MLTLPPNQTILETLAWSANATAVDTDQPPNTLTFALVSGPSQLTVSTGGAINWTPSEAQGPSTNVVTVKVSDNGTPPLSVTNSFTLVVAESNSPPVLQGQGNRIIAPLTTLFVTNTATDPDIPVNTLTYALMSPPSFATINTNTGVISRCSPETHERTTTPPI